MASEGPDRADASRLGLAQRIARWSYDESVYHYPLSRLVVELHMSFRNTDVALELFNTPATPHVVSVIHRVRIAGICLENFGQRLT